MSALAKKLARRVYTKGQLESALGCNVACADTDGKFYRYQDLRWDPKPVDGSAGVLAPRSGALSADELSVQS